MGWPESIVSEIQSNRVPLGMTLIFAGLGAWAYLQIQTQIDAEFVTEHEAETVHRGIDLEMSQIRSDLSATKTQIIQHIESYNIDSVTRDLRSVDAQLVELELHTSQFGESALTRSRKTELADMKQAMLQYRNCLLSGGVSCRKPDL